MNHPLSPLARVLLLIVFCAVTAAAQDSAGSTTAEAGSAAGTNPAPQTQSSSYTIRKGSNEFGFWSGGAFSATTRFGGLTEAEARDRRFGIVAFRYGRTLTANKHLALQYTIDAIPLAVATGNIVGSTTFATPTGTAITFTRETAYGAGLTPLGLQLNFANGSSRVKPFVHVGGGFLVFNKAVPLPDAGKFAFTADGGAGVRIFTSKRSAINLGVRLHHISNGDRSGGSNRGLNQFMVSIGFSVFR